MHFDPQWDFVIWDRSCFVLDLFLQAFDLFSFVYLNQTAHSLLGYISLQIVPFTPVLFDCYIYC